MKRHEPGIGTFEDGVNYFLDFTTYSGMTIPIESGTHRECLEAAKLAIKQAKKRGQPVDVLIPNNKWEFETREDAMCISDFDGILKIVHARDRVIL